MAIFTQGNNSCYFIHIPRTGGRYVTSLFENSENIKCMHHKIHTDRIHNIDITHLHYPLYDHYLGVEKIPHITIVRNPYTKFCSCIKNMHYIHNFDYNDILSDWKSFYKFVNTEIEFTSYHNNWFLPQNRFISPDTHIWKYEWGFGENFKKWVFNKTKISIKIQNVNYDKFQNEKTESDYNITSKSIRHIKKFYKQDYQQLKYLI